MKRTLGRTCGVTLAIVTCLAAGGHAMAQSQAGPVIKNKDVTEAALIDALTPPEDTVRTRGIRIRTDGTAPVAPAAPARRNEASLLITFATNSAELTPESRVVLEKVANALQSDKLSDFEFAVEGHADPRGKADVNLKLSQARAESVVDYLVNTLKVDRSRLQAVGKGDSEPMVQRPDAAENRRVTFRTVVR